MNSIIKRAVTTVKSLDEMVAGYYEGMSEEKRNVLVRDLWEIMWYDKYDIIDVICAVENFELENMYRPSKCEDDILDDFIYLLEENKTNAKRLLKMLIFDFNCYRAFMRLISWDKNLLSEEDFSSLIDAAKAFSYRWDGEQWIDEDEE